MFPRIKRRLRQVPTTARIMANIPANTKNRFNARIQGFIITYKVADIQCAPMYRKYRFLSKER